MINDLKDVTRGTSTRIATLICKAHKKTFTTSVDGQVWDADDGIAALRTSVESHIGYKKNLDNYQKKRNKRALSPDSDDAQIAA